MSGFTVILVFVVTWWLVFFMMLPKGVVSQHEVDEERVEGTDPGAPVSPDLGKKALYATLVAIILTILYYYIYDMGLIDFRVRPES